MRVRVRDGGGWAGAAAVVVLVIVQLALPAGPWRAAVEVPVYVIGVSAVRSGMRRYRPVSAAAWWALSAALIAFAVSSAVEALEFAGVAVALTSTAEAVLDVFGYAALTVAGVAALVTGRARRDRESWVDAATLLLAAALTAVVWADGPDGPGGLASAGDDELGIGLPLLTGVVLIAGVRLALPGSGRSLSGVALFIAGGLALLGYAGRASDVSSTPALFDALPLLAVAAVTLAARHPSMTSLGEPVTAQQNVTVGRLIGLGTALLVSPALVLLWTVRHGGNGYLLGAGIGVLTGLALWRIGRLVSDRERTRAALASSEARLQALLQHAADVIAIVDRAGRISYVSPAVEDLLGWAPAACAGRRALVLLAREDRPRLRGILADTPPTADDASAADVRLRHADGGTRWVEVKISGRLDEPGVEGWVVNAREVTDRKLLEQRLRHQATTDPLTGLTNRSEFLARLTVAMVPGAGSHAVLFLDLDDFKTINDRWGHATGDALLDAVAARVSGCVRDTDTAARLGGDEFAVLLTPADSTRTHQVATRILDELRRPLHLNGHTIHVTGSIGGALALLGDTPAELLHRADTGMYAAKRHGKNHYELLH